MTYPVASIYPSKCIRQPDISVPLFLPPYVPLSMIKAGWSFNKQSFSPSILNSALISTPTSPILNYMDFITLSPLFYGRTIVNKNNSSVGGFGSRGASQYGDILFYRTGGGSLPGYIQPILPGITLDISAAANSRNSAFSAYGGNAFFPAFMDFSINPPTLVFFAFAIKSTANNFDYFIFAPLDQLIQYDIQAFNFVTSSNNVPVLGCIPDFIKKTNHVCAIREDAGYMPLLFDTDLSGSGAEITYLNFDDAALNTWFGFGSGHGYQFQATQFGWLMQGQFPSSIYNKFGPYGCVLISKDFTRYAVVNPLPQSGAVSDGITQGYLTAPSANIDQYGRFYWHPGESGTHTYFDTVYSGGLDIPWVSSNLPYTPTHISLPTENCGCNPIPTNVPLS